MITFKTIRAKNFGSYGNYPTEIDLCNFDTTLVVGKNGSGKSTLLLDGIFFALFNKPYRKITKGLLVNSINKGSTLVELDFETKGSKYTVRRGIKPNLFEIEKDGEVLDQNVLSKDAQEYLENDILQTNPKTFGQTSVLGSSSFVPFMQLPAAGRREVVDDVLDVHVFTRMSDLAKEDLSITNKELIKKENELQIVKNKFSSQKAIVNLLNENQNDIIDQLTDRVKVYRDDIRKSDIEIDGLRGEILQLENQKIILSDDKNEVSRNTKLSGELMVLNKVLNQIDSLDKCPTCFQDVDKTHKEKVRVETLAAIQKIEPELAAVKMLLDKNAEDLKNNESINRKIQGHLFAIKSLEKSIASMKDDIEDLETKVKNAKSNSSTKIDIEKKILKEYASVGKQLTKDIDALKEDNAIQELSVKLLKDNGIKASIVKEYLPIINSLINQNLMQYGFDVNFILDENFDERIVSRSRENFVYNSFSEGEKEKIDYSIMLALRKVGASKNATNINILVLDEILDGSLDKESRAITLDILTREMEESNVFVISHTESQPTFYERVLHVEKRGDFSYIESC